MTKLGTIAFMLHPAHIRVARALLGWHQVVLARKAKVGLAPEKSTVRRSDVRPQSNRRIGDVADVEARIKLVL